MLLIGVAHRAGPGPHGYRFLFAAIGAGHASQGAPLLVSAGA